VPDARRPMRLQYLAKRPCRAARMLFYVAQLNAMVARTTKQFVIETAHG